MTTVKQVGQNSDLHLLRKVGRTDKRFVVSEKLFFSASIDGFPRLFNVPEGFETDLVSVHRLARCIVSKVDGIEASIAHDYLYRYRVVPREVADKIFLHLLRRGGVSWWRRTLMYVSVRIFGGLLRKA